jgi:formylglycine-generating enzyme required for sulfatase activity
MKTYFEGWADGRRANCPETKSWPLGPAFYNGVRDWPNPGTDYGIDLTRPVELVSWYDATDYCARLTERDRSAGRIATNAVYRLPTEAEWEYACRAWTSTRFSYGDDPGYTNLTHYAWCAGNSGDTTHPVGQKWPNSWGLHDMHGNVWEGCQDRWSSSLPGGIALDPQGPATGSCRVLRGGSWAFRGNRPVDCRSADRACESPSIGGSPIGFRVVLAPGQP